MPIPFYHPKPHPAAAFAGQPLPQNSANPISRAIFQWVAPIMSVGYSRPLQADDLWYLTDDLLCQTNADRLQANYLRRLPPSLRPAPARPVLPVKDTTSSSDDTPSTRSHEQEADRDGAPKVSTNVREPVKEEQAVAEAIDDLNPVPEIIKGEADTVDRNTAEAPLQNGVPKPPGQPRNNEKAALDPADVKRYGKRNAAKLAKGEIMYEEGKKYDMSLVRAIYNTVWDKWWIAVVLSACGSALQVTAPLVTRLIIEQIEIASAYDAGLAAGQAANTLLAPRNIGYGIGLAVALFVMEMAATLYNLQSQQRGAMIGFTMRSSLIDLISRKSVRLSSKSRIELPNGRLVTMVSADCSFLDFAAPMTLNLVVQPLQILVGIALLIYTLGYSGLVGLGVLLLATPLQGVMFVRMITYRQAQMKIVDQRVRLLSEIINNIRAVKLYAYENLFGEKVSKLRRQELSKLKRNGLNRATMFATMGFVPILAAVLTFVTYGLSGHPLTPSVIFSGLQYFNVLRQPISFLPMAFTAVSDAAVAVRRIGVALRAEELKHDLVISPSSPHAIDAQGSFQFDSVTPPDQASLPAGRGRRGGRGGGKDRAGKREAKKEAVRAKKDEKARKKQGLPGVVEKPETAKKEEGVPFSLQDIDLQIPRGTLVCVVGRVGTGKSSLLLSLINEMRQVKGHVLFGGPVSYVPQHAWVQSGTIRENITFSANENETDLVRVNDIIDACALRPDIEMWADGDLTKIGERGITLSGGQRQRICLARAAYDSASEIVLLDDPLAAVDAHVGHHILQKCILAGPLAEKTRVLVTHHLDVLPRADLVLVLDRDERNVGRIIQQGSYTELRDKDGVFRTLMEEFGSTATEEVETEEKAPKTADPASEKAVGGKLLLDEEREVGAVSWKVYRKYGQAMGGFIWVGMCLVLLAGTQGATVGNQLFLGYWSGSQIPGFDQGQYMAIYAGLGVASAIFSVRFLDYRLPHAILLIKQFSAMYTMVLAGIRASFALFNGAWKGVMRSPTGWHDRTPTGRIINRLSKDIEMLDDRLSMVWNQLLSSALSVVGTFALVVYSFPWLGLAFIPLGVIFYLAASYYRVTSREIKRVDSILRSAIYSSFGEQLAGLAVIRAFGVQQRFIGNLQDSVNRECEAYVITITIQRWLALRLNLISYILVMLIAMFGSIFRGSVPASTLGVVLTYSLSASAVFSQLVQLFAQVEQEMNNVERVQYYNDLQVEAAPTLPTDPPKGWPSKGLVEFKDVELRYRPDLPLVLKGLNFTINAGEKVGIIGRTGAGKSSIAQALFRTVELSGGRISIDGLDLSKIGLDTMRSRMGIIPQDAFLFGGSVRDNIDPTSSYDDAYLNGIMALVHTNSGNSRTFADKFKLDAVVLNEGANFSAGERQLLALVRALVKNCKVLLLDEATSSVDPETDAVIQRIIQTEMSDLTLLSIAHRLQTVAYYDRILVMEGGKVVEFDTPLALFDTPGSTFRSLCDTKRLTRENLVKIRQDAATVAKRP